MKTTGFIFLVSAKKGHYIVMSNEEQMVKLTVDEGIKFLSGDIVEFEINPESYDRIGHNPVLLGNRYYQELQYHCEKNLPVTGFIHGRSKDGNFVVGYKGFNCLLSSKRASYQTLNDINNLRTVQEFKVVKAKGGNVSLCRRDILKETLSQVA